MRTPGRNEPCPCGSGKKYKKCCALTGGYRASATVRPLDTDDSTFRSVFLGEGRQELTDDLISELAERWGCPREDLESMREEGASYNSVRDSIVFPTEMGGPMFEGPMFDD